LRKQQTPLIDVHWAGVVAGNCSSGIVSTVEILKLVFGLAQRGIQLGRFDADLLALVFGLRQRLAAVQQRELMIDQARHPA